MEPVVRGEDFEACFESGITGREGTVSLMVIDNIGGVWYAASTANIIETPAGSGNYCATRPGINVLGHYTLVWSIDGTYDDHATSTDDLFIVSPAHPSFPPLVPGAQDSGPVDGPCSAWVAAEDVATCCAIEVGDPTLFDAAATSASQLLYRLSGRQFRGSCQRTVRPRNDFPCGVQVLARGYVIGWDRAWNLDFSQVMLPNYPVTEIVEVKVDGLALAATEYRLDGWRWLTRKADTNGDRQFWPGPQRMDRVTTEEDTWEITYMHGQNPPQPGIDAAAQLACEIYKSCPGNEGVAGCKLPKNATQVTRAGITINLNALHYSASEKRWMTGMNLVDLFLNAYNPDGVKQRPLIWSPDAPQFAKEVGTMMGS